jgi:hypothetical protein
VLIFSTLLTYNKPIISSWEANTIASNRIGICGLSKDREEMLEWENGQKCDGVEEQDKILLT